MHLTRVAFTQESTRYVLATSIWLNMCFITCQVSHDVLTPAYLWIKNDIYVNVFLHIIRNYKQSQATSVFMVFLNHTILVLQGSRGAKIYQGRPLTGKRELRRENEIEQSNAFFRIASARGWITRVYLKKRHMTAYI